jgi:DNA-binding CsgD family transcriptional regulator
VSGGLDVLGLQHLYGLTRSEGRVVARLVDGRTLEEIGAELELPLLTVRTHVKRALQKTGARRQADLVRQVLLGHLL